MPVLFSFVSLICVGVDFLRGNPYFGCNQRAPGWRYGPGAPFPYNRQNGFS